MDAQALQQQAKDLRMHLKRVDLKLQRIELRRSLSRVDRRCRSLRGPETTSPTVTRQPAGEKSARRPRSAVAAAAGTTSSERRDAVLPGSTRVKPRPQTAASAKAAKATARRVASAAAAAATPVPSVRTNNIGSLARSRSRGTGGGGGGGLIAMRARRAVSGGAVSRSTNPAEAWTEGAEHNAVAARFSALLEQQCARQNNSHWPEAHVFQRDLLHSVNIQRKSAVQMERDTGYVHRQRMRLQANRQRRRRQQRIQRQQQSEQGANSGKTRKSNVTLLPRRYKRNEFPFIIGHGAAKNTVQWTCPRAQIDLLKFLPIFFDGLREIEEPYATISNEGIIDLLRLAQERGQDILPAVPRIAAALRLSFATQDEQALRVALRRTQDLLRTDVRVGRALIPFFAQLLPPLNKHIHERSNLGDGIEYAQRNDPDIGALILDTVELLEHRTGLTAFKHIKQHVPTYQSILHTKKPRV